jgi:hypothetical protein
MDRYSFPELPSIAHMGKVSKRCCALTKRTISATGFHNSFARYLIALACKGHLDRESSLPLAELWRWDNFKHFR